jgi:hypothetical protein
MTIGHNAGKCHRKSPMKEVNTVVPQAESPIRSCVGAVSF